jgi:hypothetical protein
MYRVPVTDKVAEKDVPTTRGEQTDNMSGKFSAVPIPSPKFKERIMHGADGTKVVLDGDDIPAPLPPLRLAEIKSEAPMPPPLPDKHPDLAPLIFDTAAMAPLTPVRNEPDAAPVAAPVPMGSNAAKPKKSTPGRNPLQNTASWKQLPPTEGPRTTRPARVKAKPKPPSRRASEPRQTGSQQGHLTRRNTDLSDPLSRTAHNKDASSTAAATMTPPPVASATATQSACARLGTCLSPQQPTNLKDTATGSGGSDDTIIGVHPDEAASAQPDANPDFRQAKQE